MPDSDRTLREAFEALGRIEDECARRAAEHVTQDQREGDQRLADEKLDRIRGSVEDVRGSLGGLRADLTQAQRDATQARRFAIQTAVGIGAALLAALVAVLT